MLLTFKHSGVINMCQFRLGGVINMCQTLSSLVLIHYYFQECFSTNFPKPMTMGDYRNSFLS